MTTRLFIGDLGGGDYRARISKPGFDAGNSALDKKNLLFDSAWAFTGKVHAIGQFISTTASKTVSFPELPYIPAVYATIYRTHADAPAAENNNDFYLGPPPGFVEIEIKQNDNKLRVVATNNSLTFTKLSFLAGTKYRVYYIVFRIPLKDTSVDGSATQNVPRMLIGKRDANYGLYVSQPGYDVLTCPAKRLIFSTDDVPDINLFRTYRFTQSSSHEGGGVGYISSHPNSTPMSDQGFIPYAIWYIQGRRSGTTQTMLIPQWLEADQWDYATNPGIPYLRIGWSRNRIYWWGEYIAYPRIYRGIGMIFDRQLG